MKKGYTPADYVAFSLVGAAAMAALLYIFFGWSKLAGFLVHPATAAWVQAIGSIAAILAAAAIARWQTTQGEKTASEQRRVAERGRLLAIEAVFSRALQATQVVILVVERNKPTLWELAADDVASAKAVIDRVPAFDVPFPHLVSHLQLSHRYLSQIAEAGREYAGSPNDATKNAALLVVIRERYERINEGWVACVDCIAAITRPHDPPWMRRKAPSER